MRVFTGTSGLAMIRLPMGAFLLPNPANPD